MTKAADAGLPYAQVALGRLYEQGALVGKKDIEHARALYEQAASFGDRAGLLRNALFLQSEAKADGAYQPAYRAALEQFAKRADAPAWIFIALGDFEIADKGRWGGESAAVAYYEKAEAMGDAGATKRLTPIRFRYADTPKQFYKVIDAVIDTVHTGGEIDPMNGLKDAFSCRAPQAPQRTEAQYWEGISAATGTKTVEFTPTELLALIANPNPQDIARLQTQALYGRPTAIAQYMEVLTRSNAAPEEIAFWESYANRFEGVTAHADAWRTNLPKSARTEAIPQSCCAPRLPKVTLPPKLIWPRSCSSKTRRKTQPKRLRQWSLWQRWAMVPHCGCCRSLTPNAFPI